MTAWTPREREIQTPTGGIRYGGPCRDDYPNMVTYDQGGGNTILTLQHPAMTAFKRAEARYGKRRPSKRRDIRVLPGTNRTCATQERLYHEDSSRYAKPEITGHPRGLAIDVDQSQGWLALRRIRRALLAEGWVQVRPDELWHYSYFIAI